MTNESAYLWAAPFPSQSPDEALGALLVGLVDVKSRYRTWPEVDVVICLDVEICIVELVRSLEKGQPAPASARVISSGKPIQNPPRSLVLVIVLLSKCTQLTIW